MVIPTASTHLQQPQPSEKSCARRSRLPNSDLLDDWLSKQNNLYPSREQKQRLAEDTKMSVEQVCRWFANRRRNKPYMSRGRKKGVEQRSSGTSTPQSCPSDTDTKDINSIHIHDSNNNTTPAHMQHPSLQHSPVDLGCIPPVASSSFMYGKDLLQSNAFNTAHFVNPVVNFHNMQNLLALSAAYMNRSWPTPVPPYFDSDFAQQLFTTGGGGMFSPREVSSPSSVTSHAPEVFSPTMHAKQQDESMLDIARSTAVEALLQLSEKESIAVTVLAQFQRQKRKLQHTDNISDTVHTIAVPVQNT